MFDWFRCCLHSWFIKVNKKFHNITHFGSYYPRPSGTNASDFEMIEARCLSTIKWLWIGNRNEWNFKRERISFLFYIGGFILETIDWSYPADTVTIKSSSPLKVVSKMLFSFIIIETTYIVLVTLLVTLWNLSGWLRNPDVTNKALSCATAPTDASQTITQKENEISECHLVGWDARRNNNKFNTPKNIRM